LLGDWEYAAIAVEIDANTTSGPQVDLRKAEASLQYRPDRAKPPVLMATLGQFDTPFGYELVESPRTRWFMERSQASLAFWPAEPDLGVRLAGALATSCRAPAESRRFAVEGSIRGRTPRRAPFSGRTSTTTGSSETPS